MTRSAGVSTNVSCSTSVSTTQFALLKIEVVSSTSVNFYIDGDVSNGVEWTLCGNSTTNINTAGMASMLKTSSNTVGFTLNVDYFRVWQDDAAENTDPYFDSVLYPIAPISPEIPAIDITTLSFLMGPVSPDALSIDPTLLDTTTLLTEIQSETVRDPLVHL